MLSKQRGLRDDGTIPQSSTLAQVAHPGSTGPTQVEQPEPTVLSTFVDDQRHDATHDIMSEAT